MGASIASIVALRVLLHEKIKNNKQENVLFIGFNSPAFVDKEFSKFIEDSPALKGRFHFYKIEDDKLINLLELLINIIHSNGELLENQEVMDFLKCFMQEFIELRKYSSEEGMIKKTFNFMFKSKKNNFDTNFNKFPKLKELLRGNIEEKFKLYGTIHNLKVEKQFSDNFKHKETFDVFKIDSFFSLFKRNIDVNESKKSIEFYDEVKISIQEFEKIRLYKNEIETDVFITAKGGNLDFIFNSKYNFHEDAFFSTIYLNKIPKITVMQDSKNEFELFDHVLLSNGLREIIRKSNDYVCCIFSCKNKLVKRMHEFIKSSKEDDNRIKHEEKFKSSLSLITHFDTYKFDFALNNYELNKGFRQKTKEIDEMDLDLLYIYSIFYVNIFQKLKDEEVNERSNQLKKILRIIDEIWNPEISKDQINFNEENIKEKLMTRLFSLFEYNSKDFSKIKKENYPFQNEFVSLSNYTNISEWVKCKKNDDKRKRGYNDKNLFIKLIFDILPKCNQIMEKQSSLTSFTSVNLRIYRFFTKSKIGMLLYVPVGVPISLYASLLYGIEYPLALYSGDKKSYYQTVYNFLPSLTNLSHSPNIKNCGSYEKKIYEAISRGTYKNDVKDNLLQTILLNRQIRNIFQADFQFAIIGKKKLGKSTFLETIIPSANANASAIEATVEIKPFKITERVTLNDYPHFDSTDSSHKIQFMFTRKLMDHIFFVCDAKERMDSEGTIEIFEIIKNSCGDNFTIILNKCDEYIKESKLNDYEKVLEDLKTSVLNRIGDRYEKNLIFTYLEKIGFESNLSLIDKMNRTNILMKDKLCKKIYDIMEKKIPDEEEFGQIKKNIAKLADPKNLRPNHKIITIKYHSSESRYIIKLNDTFKNPEEYDLIETFEMLVNKLKRKYKLTNPVIRPMLPKTTGNSENECKEEEIIISTLEDFIDKTDDHTFTVTDEKKGSTSDKEIKIINAKGKVSIKIITLDETNCVSDEGFDIIDSFETLQNHFKTKQNPNPRFKLQSNPDTEILSLEEFFKTIEDTFLVN
jgi:hypothetical protein